MGTKNAGNVSYLFMAVGPSSKQASLAVDTTVNGLKEVYAARIPTETKNSSKGR